LKFNYSLGFGCPTFSFHLNASFIEPTFGASCTGVYSECFSGCLQLSFPIEWLETLVLIAAFLGSILGPEGGYPELFRDFPLILQKC
jgi:hypothetical protein